MDWKGQWIKEVLSDIPNGGYRKRTEAELRDHLETECRALMEAGRSQDEARAEALAVMGQPEKLREEYKTVWRRSPMARFGGVMSWLGAVAAGGVLMYILSAFTLFPVLMVIHWFDGLYMGVGPVMPPIIQNQAFVLIAGSVTFLVPFTLEAAFLRLCFHRQRHRAARVTLALLVIWAVSNLLLIVLCTMIDEQTPGLSMFTHFYDVAPYTNAPWMTPLYHLLTFLGCILLGQLFGRRNTARFAAE